MSKSSILNIDTLQGYLHIDTLQEYLRNNDVEGAKALIKETNVSDFLTWKTQQQYDILHHAVMIGNIDLIEQLTAKSGLTLNDFLKDENLNDTTRIILAAFLNDLELTRSLIQKIDFKLLQKEEKDQIHYLIMHFGDVELFELLLNKTGYEADFAGTLTKYGISLLGMAASDGNLDMVKFLIGKSGPLAEIIDVRGYNILHTAMSAPPINIELINFIIEKSKKLPQLLTQKTNDGLSPLLLAIEEENIELLKILAKHPKELRLFQSINHNTSDNALHYALYVDDPEILKFVIDKFSPECKGELKVAWQWGDTPTIEKLSLIILNESDELKKSALTDIFKEALKTITGEDIKDKDVEDALYLYLSKNIISLNYSDNERSGLHSSINLAKLELLMLKRNVGDNLSQDETLPPEVKSVLEDISKIDKKNPIFKTATGEYFFKSSILYHDSNYLVYCDQNDVPTSVSYIDGNNKVTIFNITPSSPPKFSNTEELAKSLASVTNVKEDILSNIAKIVGPKEPSTDKVGIKFQLQKRGNCTAKSLNILTRSLLELKGSTPEEASNMYKKTKYQLVEKCVKNAQELSPNLMSIPFFRNIRTDTLKMAEKHASKKISNQKNSLNNATASKVLAISRLGLSN
jgi:ankyrin repeat protein